MKCNNCGNMVPDDSEFCQFCGNKVETPSLNVCKKCGKELLDNSKFCSYCGCTVEEVKVSNPGASSGSDAERNNKYQNINKENENNSEKGVPQKKIVIIGLSVLTVLLLGLSIFWLCKANEYKTQCDIDAATIEELTAQVAQKEIEIVNINKEISNKNEELEEVSKENEDLKVSAKEKQIKINKLNDDLFSMEDELWAAKWKLGFYEDYACVVGKNSKTYHLYGCPELDTSEFWIFNIGAAKQKGYKPCSYCY